MVIRARVAPTSEVERIVVDLFTDHDLDRQLWWETLDGKPPDSLDRLDPLAIALLPKAMNFSQDLHLEGPVSYQLLANLEEFVDAWTHWRPDIFQRVRITAEEIIDDRTDAPGPLAATAMCAFSGGVDATYATFAHRNRLLGRRSLDLAGAVLVHGFDIPLDDPEGFAVAARAAAVITGELEIPLVTMRTNWQAVADPEWEMSFGAALGSVLHLFSDRAGVAAMAADNTYSQITIPWGSNPITGPLLSSSRMRLVHTGAGQTRTQKCEAIGQLDSVREHIRVCWAGDDLGRNCGRCEKCVRTKVNFLAAGHGVVPALGPLEPRQLRTLTISSEGAYAIYAEMRDELHLLPPDVADDLVWLLDQPIQPHSDHGTAVAAVEGSSSRWRRRRG
ncbi:hypothetical protein [Aquihabitans sp. McL0605]|uniref:hypothetical protein n=1 Tax=Aquihabitans sp. McL0605 TaxID=3415671 RepID=UPI003CF18DAB